MSSTPKTIKVTAPNPVANASLADRAFAEALAGAGGGILSMTLCYPLMNVSTRQQVQQRKESDGASGGSGDGAAAAAAATPVEPKYRGILHALTVIAREEGLPGLYAGLGSAIFGQAVTQFVYYWAYSSVKTSAQRLVAGERLSSIVSGAPVQRDGKLRELSVAGNLLVGAIAGTITAVSTHPIWTINTLAMTQSKAGQSSGFFKIAADILKKSGVKGLFRGLGPALILVSNPTIQFMVFSKCREYWLRTRGRGSALSSLEVFVLGAIAKIAATLVTYPYLLVKSNMQTQKDAGGAGAVISQVFRTEGLSGFYKGLRSKILQSVLMAALLFVFQDKLLQYTLRLIRAFRK